ASVTVVAELPVLLLLPQALAASVTAPTSARIRAVRVSRGWVIWGVTRASDHRIYDARHMSEHSVWLFDFDGTLADSEALILASFRYAAQRVLGAVPDDDVLRAGIGQTLEQQARNQAAEGADEPDERYGLHEQTSHAWRVTRVCSVL